MFGGLPRLRLSGNMNLLHLASSPTAPPHAADSSADAEVSITPAPDSDMLLVDSSSEGQALAAGDAAGVTPHAPLGSDDADMAEDAVVLEYDTAEQLLSLAQLSLAEAAQEAAQPAPQQEQQPQAATAREESDEPGSSPGNGSDAAAAKPQSDARTEQGMPMNPATEPPAVDAASV